MITLKTSQHLRRMRHLKSFRSGATSTGRSMWRVELGRLHQEEVARINRELRRRWLALAWSHHLRSVGPRGGAD